MSCARFKSLLHTVGFRITVWHAATFVVGAMLVFVAAYFLLRHVVDEQGRDLVEVRLVNFGYQYRKGGAPAVIELCLQHQGRAQKASFVRMADVNNHTTFLRDAEDWAEFSPQQLDGQPVADGVTWRDFGGLEGSILRVATQRMEDGMILQVGKTLEARQQLLERFRSAMIVIALAMILLGVIGGATAAFRALRPVHQLTASVQSILDTGKFAARVSSRGTGDEIDELVRCFNTLLGKIDLLIRGMHDSLDNVAHDLRTPMTRLRNIATKAIEQNYDQAASHEALGDCLEESERVLSMLVTLMDIAEAEAGVMNLTAQKVNVRQLARQVVDLYEHVAEEKGIAISVEVPEVLELSGDAGRLQRALANLVDNALKYTPAGGRVTIHGSRGADGLTIEVSDTGVGISKDEQSRIWERLYRVDKSRSQRGLGLGLSFVKAIAEAHRGKVAVESDVGRGARFILQFQG
jgi:signal transduction histidine kinase